MINDILHFLLGWFLASLIIGPLVGFYLRHVVQKHYPEPDRPDRE